MLINIHLKRNNLKFKINTINKLLLIILCFLQTNKWLKIALIENYKRKNKQKCLKINQPRFMVELKKNLIIKQEKENEIIKYRKNNSEINNNYWMRGIIKIGLIKKLIIELNKLHQLSLFLLLLIEVLKLT